MASKLTDEELKLAQIDAELILKVTTLASRVDNTISMGILAEQEYQNAVKAHCESTVVSHHYALANIKEQWDKVKKNVPSGILQFVVLDVIGKTHLLNNTLDELQGLFSAANKLTNTITRKLGDLNHKLLGF